MENAIAIIGIDCKFPGAGNKEEFWDLLKNGKDAVDGIGHMDYANGYRSFGKLDGIEEFDAEFFKINPNDAKYMDPQQRLFLESAWRVVEDAGYRIEKMNKSVGVFAGCGINSYLMQNVIPYVVKNNKDYSRFLTQIIHGNSNDYLTSRVSYEMDFIGPSVTVQTACSSSLTAIHLACRSLLLYECDMAISGGISINTMQDRGYQYRKGEIFSKSGKCAPFSLDRDGTIFSSGVGTVMLKRYEEAVEDEDYIYAVIRGSAIGNDGADKISYMSPSIKGQENVIRIATDVSGIEGESISYIETHGTGTEIGDKIELQALKQALPQITHCYLGSVKGNIGHTMAAAGIAGLIKTVLCLNRGYICPSIHCNEKMEELKESPFEVNSDLIKWKSDKCPRRAGISSFGMGGANAHMILEENTDFQLGAYKTQENDKIKFLKLSSKTEYSLQKMKDALINFLKTEKISNEELIYAFENRCEFPVRQLIYFKNREELINELNDREIINYEIESIKKIMLNESLKSIPEFMEFEKTINLMLTEKTKSNNAQKILNIDNEDALLELLKYFWEKGENINFKYERTRKIPVPSYQFQGKKYWIEDTEEQRLFKECDSELLEINSNSGKEYIRKKWEKYLEIENIGDKQNFFEMGGHSIMAIQIIAEIEDEIGITLEVENILENPTIENMYNLINK